MFRELRTDMQRAQRLVSRGDPSDAQAIDAWLAMAMFANGRFDEAISQARLAVAELSNDSGQIAEVPWLALISAQYFSGNDTAAKAQLQNFLSRPRVLSNLAAVKKVPTPGSYTQAPGGVAWRGHAGRLAGAAVQLGCTAGGRVSG
jgi:hypothetical protein